MTATETKKLEHYQSCECIAFENHDPPTVTFTDRAPFFV
jgi:hypothetical protein